MKALRARVWSILTKFSAPTSAVARPKSPHDGPTLPRLDEARLFLFYRVRHTFRAVLQVLS